MAGTVYNWLTKIFSLLIFCQVVVRIKLEQIIHCTTLSKKKPTCASTKINTVPYQDHRDLDVCQLTKQRVFLKKRESVKKLLLGLVLNEPTHISKFFAILETHLVHISFYTICIVHDGSPSVVEPVCPDDFGKLIFILFRE